MKKKIKSIHIINLCNYYSQLLILKKNFYSSLTISVGRWASWFSFLEKKLQWQFFQKLLSISCSQIGEGGIILLPGASIDESFTDEDEEIRKYLEAPPSPCDVTFINDNILIDGKSSIRQRTKNSRVSSYYVLKAFYVFFAIYNTLFFQDGNLSLLSFYPERHFLGSILY